MTNETMTALKMLKARGGALDLKAAELIEGLLADLVGKRVGEKLDDRLDKTEIARLTDQIHGLQGAIRDRDVDLNRLFSEIKVLRQQLALDDTEARGMRMELEEVRQELGHILYSGSVLSDICELDTARSLSKDVAEYVSKLRQELAGERQIAADSPSVAHTFGHQYVRVTDVTPAKTGVVHLPIAGQFVHD